MIKKDFLAKIAEKTGSSAKAAGEFYDAFVDSVEEALKSGDKVQLTGFGNFELKSKPAREGINPATKEKITIKASKSPAFKVGKQFKDKFN
jgi:DNA-binding protein HU-beta